jgi:hypothetical protein
MFRPKNGGAASVDNEILSAITLRQGVRVMRGRRARAQMISEAQCLVYAMECERLGMARGVSLQRAKALMAMAYSWNMLAGQIRRYNASSMARRGIEPALYAAYAVFFLETIGAVMIMLGLFTRSPTKRSGRIQRTQTPSANGGASRERPET